MTEELNAWGEPIEPEDPDDPYHVPEGERIDHDYEEDANALGETGDDVSDANIPTRPDLPPLTAEEKEQVLVDAIDAPVYAEDPYAPEAEQH